MRHLSLQQTSLDWFIYGDCVYQSSKSKHYKLGMQKKGLLSISLWSQQCASAKWAARESICEPTLNKYITQAFQEHSNLGNRKQISYILSLMLFCRISSNFKKSFSNFFWCWIIIIQTFQESCILFSARNQFLSVRKYFLFCILFLIVKIIWITDIWSSCSFLCSLPFFFFFTLAKSNPS